MPDPFQPFTREHLIAVGVGAAVVAFWLMAGKRGGDSERRATALLAFLNFATYPLGQAAWLSLDAQKSLDNHVPLHLCDIASITAGFALLTRRPLLCALTYFWGMAATFQGLLTPNIAVGFPHLPFLMFFVHHFAIVAAALYIPVVLGWRPRSPIWKSPVEVFLWSVVYLAVALTANSLLGTNFGFVSRPPDNPSLIDHLGAWPWYLLWMAAIAMALYFLLALPLSRRPPAK